MRNLSLSLIALVCAIAVTSSGCTRKTDKNNAIVTLDLSSLYKSKNVKSQSLADSGYYVDVIILNVTGSGIPTQVFQQWNSNYHNSQSTPQIPPDSFSLTVPQGSNRLFQALLVISPLPSNSSGSSQFYYGDVTQSVSDSNVGVGISVTSLATASGGGDSRITGRYIDASGHGPTGRINVYYKIPGKPRMLVDNNNFAFGGWFSVFGMDGLAFQYTFEDGADILGGPMAVDSSSFSTAQTMRLSIPDYFYSWDANSATVNSRSHSNSVSGWFGPGAAGKKVCYSTTPHSVSGAYVDQALSTPLQWDPKSSTSNTIQVSNGVAAPVDADGICQYNGGTRFVDYIPYVDQLANNHDQALGFVGPFKLFLPALYGNASSLYVDLVNSALSVTWQFLPGVQSSDGGAIDGIEVFGRIEASSRTNNGDADYRSVHGDGAACDLLLNLGFTSLGSTDVNSDGSSKGVLTASNLPSGFAVAFGQGMTTIIACPYSNIAGARTYFVSAAISSGMSCGSCGATGNKLDMRIVGNQSNSQIYGMGLGSNAYTMLKSDFNNGNHNLIFQMGGMILQQADFVSAIAQASIDNGTTWTTINTSTLTTNGFTVGTIPTGTYNTPLSALLNSKSGDVTLLVKFTLSSTVQSSYGLTSATYTSGPLSLLNSGNCTSTNAGSLVLYDVTTSSPYASLDAMLSNFNVANGTDIKKTLNITWANCPTARANFDSFHMSGTTTPPNCFTQADFKSDPNDPFNFIIDPSDTGQDCTFGGPIDFFTPGNFMIGASSYTIKHSTTPSAFATVMVNNPNSVSIVGNLNLVLDLFNIGATQNLSLLAAKVNTDGRFVNTASSIGIGSGTTAWSVPATSWTTTPSNAPGLSLTSATVPPAVAMSNINISDSGLTGFVPGMVLPDSNAVMAVSESSVDGGSPIMAVATANSFKLAYIPYTQNGFNGSNIVYLNLPTDANILATPSVIKVFAWNPGGMYTYVYVAAGFTPGFTSSVPTGHTKYMFGVMQGHGSLATIKWNPTLDNNVGGATDLIDAMVITDNAQNHYAVHANVWQFGTPTTTVDWGMLPTYNGTSFSGATFISNGSSFGVATGARHLGLVKCGNELMVVVDTGGYFKAYPFDPTSTGVIFGNVVSDGTSVSTHTRVACLAANPDPSGNGARVFLTYNPASSGHLFHAFEAGNTYRCGGASPGATLTLSGLYSGNTINYSPISGGITTALGVYNSSGTGFLMTYQASTTPTVATFLPYSGCSAGYVTLPDTGKQTWGSLAAPATSLNGLQSYYDFSNPNSTSFTLFGAGHQFYKFHKN